MPNFIVNIEPTSNEQIVKFIADQPLTKAESFEFSNIEEARVSPLAQELFRLPFVKTIFISQNFIAIEKFDIVDWESVQNEVADSIKTYLSTEKPVIIEPGEPRVVPVTIYAESTPNPAVMKFVANKPLVKGIFEFKNVESAASSPLAVELFNFPFVKEVFISSNYVSITKLDSVEWFELTNEVREFIRNYLESGGEIIKTAAGEPTNGTQGVVNIENRELNDIDKEIIAILDEYIKPAVAGDGGHIAFESFDPDSKTVRVILQGACSGCPSSTVTLKNGIETMLREMLQGRVQTVEAING